MKMMTKWILNLILAGAAWAAAPLQAAKTLYQNNFEKAEIGAVPNDFLVLDGGFTVKQEGANKFLELPGAPLESFGVLFGPTEKEGVAVSARIFGTGKGRRFPTFGVGINGVGGYRLLVSPGKKLVELYKGETVRASMPFEWEPGKWTSLRLQIQKSNDGEWKVRGTVFADKAPSAVLAIGLEDKEEPVAGRASIWGSPYSGTPIRFDDLSVVATSE